MSPAVSNPRPGPDLTAPAGVGIDVVSIARVAEACRRWGTLYTRRLLGPEEVSAFGTDAIAVASLLAVKEAAIKAWTARGPGFDWSRIEVAQTTPPGDPTPWVASLAVVAPAGPTRQGIARDLDDPARPLLDVAWTHGEDVAVGIAVPHAMTERVA